jgi:hypothetical protein
VASLLRLRPKLLRLPRLLLLRLRPKPLRPMPLLLLRLLRLTPLPLRLLRPRPPSNFLTEMIGWER